MTVIPNDATTLQFSCYIYRGLRNSCTLHAVSIKSSNFLTQTEREREEKTGITICLLAESFILHHFEVEEYIYMNSGIIEEFSERLYVTFYKKLFHYITGMKVLWR